MSSSNMEDSKMESYFALLENTPDTLLDLTLEVIVKGLKDYLHYDDKCSVYRFKGEFAIPKEISEKILRVYQKGNCIKDDVLYSFNNSQVTPLENITLIDGKISDEGFSHVMTHCPKNLSIIACEKLSEDINDIINEYGHNLVNLKMVSCPGRVKQAPRRDFEFNTPRLRRLILNYYQLTSFPIVNMNIVNQITYLDFSECFVTGIHLPDLPNIECLILYNTLMISEIMKWIRRLHSLKHLDISRSDEGHGTFARPNTTLAKLVANLPLLEHLDISGTNLAGTGAAAMVRVETSDDEDDDASDNDDEQDAYFIELCDVPGLASRVNKPLKFLGLYGTPYGACKRHHIPAATVSGDSCEHQILIAASVYMNRPAMIMRVLNDLYYLFRNDKIDSVWNALSVVLKAMETHPQENHIQIAGSASLFYVVKGRERENIGMKLTKRIILAVLVAMENHPADSTIMRNCCLTICQFNVPSEVLFIYERLVMILISGIVMASEVFMMRIGTYLLNSLACQVDKFHKVYLGDCGVMRCMLQIITDRLDNDACDDIMAMAWSTMWNVTDETPKNCQMFLEDVGLNVFQKCLQRFPDKPELLRNMMGLLGNVAEVEYLRPQLMDKRLIVLFKKLLDSENDGIEVSYNAAGVLSHLASDGPEAWILDEPSREDVLEHIAVAIDKWNICSERNINYRSFGPILALLRAFHTPQCQHWAVWALANLTTMYPEKYCRLLESEGGIQLLNAVQTEHGPYEVIRNLADTVIKNCVNYSLRFRIED